MSTHKAIDRVCVIVLLFALVLTGLFMNGEALGIQTAQAAAGYETRLFDTSRVHTIDIEIDDWDSFLQTCQSEEYSPCSVVIDGEACRGVGIRGKGNTSLSTVASMNSSRYSFKIEFDHYDSSQNYYGLDKLSLNNTIQDTTYMKDYLTYQLMSRFGVAAPLCSYVYLTVNGEDWGLYLAVEAIEESFLRRNYGTDYGELYKPDSLSFGGGRGNGMEFDMDDLLSRFEQTEESDLFRASAPSGGVSEMPSGGQPNDLPDDPGGGNGGFGGGFSGDFGGNFGGDFGDFGDFGGFGGDLGGDELSMGSSDVKLQYIDDDPDSYSNIFDNAKTDVTEADKNRLICSLKTLSDGEDPTAVLDVDQVLRYFVVHNFVVNGDSYTGSMIHNYYLYEQDGQLSMLPWDYNLAFGTFQGGDARSAVNDPIDSPLSVTGSGDRPIIDWIFSNEEYTRLYHQYFEEFLAQTDFDALIDATAELIAPYVEKDPTAFYSYEEFEAGVAALRQFCRLRAESVAGQLAGEIPSTDAGQSADPSSLVDASSLSLSDMGTMGGGNAAPGAAPSGGQTTPEMPESSGELPATAPPSGGIPDGFDPSASPSDLPQGGNAPTGDGSQGPSSPEMPDDLRLPETQDTRPDGTVGADRPGGAAPSAGTMQSAGGVSGSALLLALSCAVLLLGLLIAWRFRH